MRKLDKYRSVGVLRSGYKASVEKVIRDCNGSTETHHWDGSVDTNIVVKPVQIKTVAKEEID